MMENRNETRLEEDVHELALLLSELGAIDVFVLPSASGQRLIEAREKAFWLRRSRGRRHHRHRRASRVDLRLHGARR